MATREIVRGILSFLFKVILVLLLIAVMFIVGAMVGYGVIGDGDPMAIFEPELWEHMMSYFLRP